MTLTIAKLKVDHKLSEETRCFSCAVLLDGREAFQASNRGNGGTNEYWPLPKGTHDDIQNATAHAKVAQGEEFEPLDSLIDHLITVELNRKILRKALKSGKLLAYENGNLVRYNHITFVPSELEHYTKSLKQSNPHAVILNGMDEHQAAELISQESEDSVDAVH